MENKVIIGSGQGEITEKKSRFIASVFEVHSEDEALSILEDTRKKYWDARHNCYAYVLGPKGETERFSDDKEPSGTAGRPILDVIKGSCVSNCLIIVTRYFGGILLGTGGLVRAYSESARAGLDASNILPVLSGFKVTFACEYKDAGAFEKLLVGPRFYPSAPQSVILNKDYGEKITIEAILADPVSFEKDALNITKGTFSFISSDLVSYCPDGTIYHF